MHNALKYNHGQVQCIFSTVTLQDGGFVGGWAMRRQAAGRENLSHRHLTKSHRSSFSCRRKKNGDDGQAEQNEVKLILFKRGDRYSRSVCMCTCVRAEAFLQGMSISRKTELQWHDCWASLSIQWHKMCACMCVCVCILRYNSKFGEHEEVKSWKVHMVKDRAWETFAPTLKHLKFKCLNEDN